MSEHFSYCQACDGSDAQIQPIAENIYLYIPLYFPVTSVTNGAMSILGLFYSGLAYCSEKRQVTEVTEVTEVAKVAQQKEVTGYGYRHK